MQKFFKTFILSAVILLFVVSCSSQKKFAKEFVLKSKQYKIMVLAPQIVYKNNLNTHIADSLNITDEEERDSMLREQSRFLKIIDDSLFIANYILGYKSELLAYGIEVLDENHPDAFLNEDSNTYLVNIAQIEIEEEDYEYRDETEYFDYIYFHDHLFKAVNINTWFEINQLDDTSVADNVFYATNTITDELTSSYNYNVFNEKVEYFYEIDSLTLSGIYEYVYLLGRIYATYSFDFMMNRYVQKKQGLMGRREELLRYNPNTSSFFYAGQNRFVAMDE